MLTHHSSLINKIIIQYLEDCDKFMPSYNCEIYQYMRYVEIIREPHLLHTFFKKFITNIYPHN